MIKFRFSRALIALVFALAILNFNSCLDPKWDFERISDEVILTPGIAAPVLYGNFSINDILNELDSTEFLDQDENQLLYLTFTQDSFSSVTRDLVEIPDQNFNEIFVESEIALSPKWIALEEGDTAVFTKEQNAKLVFEDGERIDSLHLKYMDFVIDVESSFKHEGYLTIYAPQILKDGKPYETTVQVSDPSGNFTDIISIPVTDYNIYFDTSSPDGITLPLRLDLSLIKSENPILLTDNCDILISMRALEDYAIFGYFGSEELLVSDGEFNIDIFDSEEFGVESLLFADPKFNLKIVNSYGIPAEIDLSGLQTYSKANDVTTDIVFEPGVNPFQISSPGIKNVGDTAFTLIQISKDNCNLIEALESAPSQLIYNFSGMSNPDGDASDDNFVTDSSNIDVDFEVILPLYISADGFSLETKEEFDFEDLLGDETDFIDYLRLTLDVKNGFPTEVDMQLYFLDEDEVTLDSMFTSDEFLLPPTINEDDAVENPREQSKSIEFTGEKIDRIRGSKYLLIKANVSTPGASEGEYVKFYSYYTLDYKVKIKADLSVNSRDF